jgi:hypothetical protein
VLRFDQLIDHRGRGGEAYAAALPTRRDAQAGEQMGLARATVADQDDGLGARNVVAVGEGADLRGGDLRRLGEVELLQSLQPRQMRVLQPARNRMPLPLVDLGGEQGLE